MSKRREYASRSLKKKERKETDFFSLTISIAFSIRGTKLVGPAILIPGVISR
jgi:hypothetical protein